MARLPIVRWLVSVVFGFLVAAIIVNLTLPIIVDIDTPDWFMKTFPVLGGPVLWLGFAILANFLIKRVSSKAGLDGNAT